MVELKSEEVLHGNGELYVTITGILMMAMWYAECLDIRELTSHEDVSQSDNYFSF